MEPAKTKDELEVDDLLEEFDEKVKLHRDEVPDEL
jgi:hypothetical protein